MQSIIVCQKRYKLSCMASFILFCLIFRWEVILEMVAYSVFLPPFLIPTTISLIKNMTPINPQFQYSLLHSAKMKLFWNMTKKSKSGVCLFCGTIDYLYNISQIWEPPFVLNCNIPSPPTPPKCTSLLFSLLHGTPQKLETFSSCHQTLVAIAYNMIRNSFFDTIVVRMISTMKTGQCYYVDNISIPVRGIILKTQRIWKANHKGGSISTMARMAINGARLVETLHTRVIPGWYCMEDCICYQEKNSGDWWLGESRQEVYDMAAGGNGLAG